jgi:hypothetical protein
LENKAEATLNPIFLLMYYMGFTYVEARNLPIPYRHWFLERISKELEKSSEEGSTSSRALHTNTPDIRAMQGRMRHAVPARLRRFS